MAKEKNYNPVQEQRKADKAKALKKGKATSAKERDERFAQRNPSRIQSQIDDLKAITSGGGQLSRHEEQVLEGLEKQLKAVNKARTRLGDNAPAFSDRGTRQDGGDWSHGRGVLGKRNRTNDGAGSSSDEDVPEEVKRIPMPRDTPPPIPKEVLDKWHNKRREAWAQRNRNANMEPLGDNARQIDRAGNTASETPAAAEPPAEIKTVYEAKPVLRDLRKEAAAFIPAAVRAKIDKSQGKGGLIEPDEADALEQQGYVRAPAATETSRADVEAAVTPAATRQVMMEEVEDADS